MGFTFNGITTDSMGIVVNSIQTYVKPQKKAEVIQVEGRDGAEVVEYGYAPYILKAKVTLLNLTLIDNVIAWLNGSGVLIIDEDNQKYRNVRVLSAIDYDYFSHLKQATIEFYVADPFRYLITEANVTLLVAGNVTNSGTYTSLPLIKLTGTGLVTVTINGRSFTYNFDTPYVYIDSQIQDAYYNGILKNRNFGGDFPKLDVGVNAISWTGTVTEMVITKRTRYL